MSKTLFKWKRHRSARALVAAFFSSMGADLSDLSVEMSDGSSFSPAEFTKQIEALGSWGFTRTKAKPPEIHYWHTKKTNLPDLACLLGHEVGHNLGKRTTGLREELRADEYGEAAAQVVQQLLRTKAAR